METTAAVLTEPTDAESISEAKPARLDSVEVREPAREEVLVEVVAASLCGTDVAIARGGLGRRTPLVMGHEGAGVVRVVGDDVDSVEPGDHVVLGRIACGTCRHCRQGHTNLCTRRSEATDRGTLRTGNVGFSVEGTDVYHCHGVSSFSEYTLVDEEVAVKITDDLPLENASVLGCGVVTGVGSVLNTADIESGSSVAVFGLGGVGLSALQGAVLRGASEIVAVDVVPEKLEVAASLGATAVVNATEGTPIDQVRDAADGGVDYAFDAAGNTTVTEQAVAVLAPKGTAVLVGHPSPGERSLDLDVFQMVKQERCLCGSYNGSSNHPIAIPKLAEFAARGKLSLEGLVSDTRPLSEVNEAMEELEHGSAIRQVLVP